MLGHSMVTIMAIYDHLTDMARLNMAMNMVLLVSMERTCKMWIICENGIEKIAPVKKLWPNQI